MRTVEISRLFTENQERLEIQWVGGRDGGGRMLSRDTDVRLRVSVTREGAFATVAPADPLDFQPLLILGKQAGDFDRAHDCGTKAVAR